MSKYPAPFSPESYVINADVYQNETPTPPLQTKKNTNRTIIWHKLMGYVDQRCFCFLRSDEDAGVSPLLSRARQQWQQRPPHPLHIDCHGKRRFNIPEQARTIMDCRIHNDRNLRVNRTGIFGAHISGLGVLNHRHLSL